MVHVCAGSDTSSKGTFCHCLKTYLKNRATRVQFLLSINIFIYNDKQTNAKTAGYV